MPPTSSPSAGEERWPLKASPPGRPRRFARHADPFVCVQTTSRRVGAPLTLIVLNNFSFGGSFCPVFGALLE